MGAMMQTLIGIIAPIAVMFLLNDELDAGRH